MASNKSASTALPLLLILAYLFFFIEPSEAGGSIVTYWGGTTNQDMSTLANTIGSTAGGIVGAAAAIAANVIGGAAGGILGAAGIVGGLLGTCQSQGVNVFVSLNRNNLLSSLPAGNNAQQVSDYVWNNYLGGHSNSRPFGDDFVFDGIEFDIINESGSGSGQFWVDVARYLKDKYSQQQRKFYLSASVPCVFQDAPAIKAAGLFDSIRVRFFNNPECEFRVNAADALLLAWNQWTTQVNYSSQIFLGLPAAPGAACSGYIPPDLLTSSVLPIIKTSPKYGGVMLWDSFYDQQTRYSAAIINSV